MIIKLRARPPVGSSMHGTAAGCFAGALLLLAGCAAGPDFKKPAPPDVKGYTAAPLAPTAATPGIAGGEAQRFVNGGTIPADWWMLFRSGKLNALVKEALANNHDVKAAQAALKAAHETVLAQRGAYFPSVSAGFSASRQQQPMSLAPVPNNNAFQYDLFTPEVAVSYTPDLFGLNRRTVESAAAQAQSVRFQMVATYITLATNVTVSAIQQASLQAQVEAAKHMIVIEDDSVGILKYQLSKGYAGGLDLAAQQSQLAQTQAALPPLIKQLEQQRHLTAILVGRYPDNPPPALGLADLQLPRDLPVSLPSTLIEQRPDVRQAQANMHAASAQIGIAAANRLPNIQLSANAGSTALAIGQLFGPGTGFWTLGADLAAPIFQGGTLRHRERGARDAYVHAAEQYKSTVLAAFQNVADTLVALQQDAEALKTASAASGAAEKTLTLTERQYKDGYTNYLALLAAQQAALQAQTNLVQAQAARFADTAALFQALGGGWWNAPDLAEDKNED